MNRKAILVFIALHCAWSAWPQINSSPYTFVTLAGQAGIFGSSNGLGTNAQFFYPCSVAVDTNGNVYVADQNDTIREISPAGSVSTVAGLAGVAGTNDGIGGAARFLDPQGVTVEGTGTLYVADTGNHIIRRITTDGLVSTLAGLPGTSGGVDGTNSAARFNDPAAVAVDGASNLYVADSGNHAIRRVTPDATGTNWAVTTFAGLLGSMGSVNGAGGSARFRYPDGVVVDGAGNVYVSDTGNETIREINPSRLVTTLAGLAGNYGSADGISNGAQFYFPAGIAVDGSGNVFVSDYGNSAIRRVTSNGVVSTLAGSPGNNGAADGTGSVARFYNPWGMAVDSAGNLYVGDYNNHTIRKGFVYEGPLLIEKQPQSIGVVRTINANFSVNAAGPGPLGYQWQFNGANLTDGGQIRGSGANRLTIANATTNNAGSYRVIVTNRAPNLAPLGNYGGLTLTMPPLPGSPAVDAAAPTTLATDQRGFPRTLGVAPDIGAVEGIYNAAGPGNLTGITLLAGGPIRFAFTNYSDTSYTALAATNVAWPLNMWSNLGSAVETPVGSGQFQFTDPTAINYLQRYYRVKSP